MSNIQVKLGQDNNVKVRVGQQNTSKILSSASSFSRSVVSENVIGGIASVSSLYVSGISTIVGVASFKDNVYIDGDLYIQDDLILDELTSRELTSTNVTVTGLTSSFNLKVSNSFYYTPSYPNGIAYFNSTGLMVSTGSTSFSVDYTNYVLTTNNSGVPTWSNVIDGGSY